MATTTDKGFPYPESTDPDKPRIDLEKLAEAIDQMPGVVSMTALEISNLTDVWPGRLAYATDGMRLFVNTDGTAAGWALILDLRVPLQIGNGGTGLQVAPQMLVNLASTSVDSPLKTQPRPGVVGILPVTQGGTGGETPAFARQGLGVPSKDDVGDTDTNFVAIFENAMNA